MLRMPFFTMLVTGVLVPMRAEGGVEGALASGDFVTGDFEPALGEPDSAWNTRESAPRLRGLLLALRGLLVAFLTCLLPRMAERMLRSGVGLAAGSMWDTILDNWQVAVDMSRMDTGPVSPKAQGF